MERLRKHGDLAREGHEATADEFDLASEESDRSVTLRLLDKERKLLAEIERAIARFDDGTYGLCEGNGEPIGYGRLSARPWAKYSLAYKEELEIEERGYRRG
jgi:DnaK suppressor protein